MAQIPLSVTIITLNEEANIGRAIKSVQWASEVLVVDSGSTDRTVEIAKSLGAKVLLNAWKGYGQQKNFAQKSATHDWILNIDADEEVPQALAREIQLSLASVADGKTDTRGFFFPRKTYYLGRWIKHGGWYPNFLVRLSDRKKSHWTEPFVHEHLVVDGTIQGLAEPLAHFAFPGIIDQVTTNLRFSELGSLDLKQRGQKPSLFWLIFKPIGKFFETYFIKRGFMDGLPGLIISINASYSMFLKYAYLFETELRNEGPHH